MPSAIEARRRRVIAAFGALCLFFSAIEQLLPRPIPSFRLGLSNIPVLLALDFMGPAELLALVAAKVIGQALLGGTLSSYVFLFSLSGSLASLLAMYPLKRLLKDRISLVGVGSAGALASNAVQVLLAVNIILEDSAVVIAPLLLGIGTATGVLMGAFAQAFQDKSAWLARARAAWRGEER